MEERQEQRQKRITTKKSVVSKITIVVAVFIFVLSAYQLIRIFSEYHKGAKEYDKLAEDTTESQEEENEEEALGQDGHTPLKVDFEELKKTNVDVVGWIHFDEPSISYPIVKGEDNEKYLTTTFEKNKNSAGAIFMDALNNGEFADRNTYIYGHNMKNGSMFAQLHKFGKQEYYEQNPYFYIYTPNGKEVKYQIFAVCIVGGTSRSYTRFFNNDTEYLDYLNYEKSIALYDTGVEVNAESQILTLSTCISSAKDKRLFVHGVKVGETEVKK